MNIFFEEVNIFFVCTLIFCTRCFLLNTEKVNICLDLIAQVQLFVVICARQCQSVVGVLKTLKNTPPLYVLPPSDASQAIIE